MPRAREDKPPFSAVPTLVLERIAALLGAPVAGGDIAWGGFSPSANYLLTLADGRRVFAKGNHPGDMAHGTQNLRQDIAVYETAPVLAQIAPRYLGVVGDGDEDGWMLGLWDAVDKDPAPPALARAMDALVAWQTGAAPDLPSFRDKNYISGFFTPDRKWARARKEPAVHAGIAALFPDAAEGRAWLARNLDALIALQAATPHAPGPHGPLHGDLHPSNIFQTRDGRVMIVDWPNACMGPLAFDALFLGAALGDVPRVLDAYRAASGHAMTPDETLPIAAALSGFMADQARRAPPPRLPRLRWMQKTMLWSLLDFLSGAGAIRPIAQDPQGPR